MEYDNNVMNALNILLNDLAQLKEISYTSNYSKLLFWRDCFICSQIKKDRERHCKRKKWSARL